MIYLTRTRLIRESEHSVKEGTAGDDERVRRVCASLLASAPRYATWMSSHDPHMTAVAQIRLREPQLQALRRVGSLQIHRAALVRHLHDNEITGERRSALFREFHGTLDTQCAALSEHRVYTQAVSSQLCARDLLEMSGDTHGVELLDRYQREFGVFFSMHCDRMTALAEGRRYLLASLMPEVRASATRLRERLLSGERLPQRPVFVVRNGYQ